MSSEAKVFKFEEVSRNNSKDSCWLIISGKVYDVTPFLDDHPGGDEILLTATGKDATEDFEDVGHSDDAREMMKKYYIGEVDVSTIPVKQKPVRPQVMRQAAQQGQASGFLIKFLQFALPLLILGLAFALKKLKKEE
uniref:Cytochrome b5 heme-binding domain-containing protein n=1 Tax=Opuntia streptacantha TaxID=393608 RepID=A0A7C9DWU4_OPUST